MTNNPGVFKYSKTVDAMAGSMPSNVRFRGILDGAAARITEGLFLKLDVDGLVSWFKDRSDPFAAGEFFGKILRAASNICAYTGDCRLRSMIDTMVRKILLTADSDGCISTVRRENQPNGSNGSDLWERKYVLLGLFEYFENFGPTLDRENDVYDAMISLAEYTASQIGDGEGRTRITDTGWAFCGIESSSILEPVMKLYLLSGNKKLFDFGTYIVSSGACSRENIFKAALSGKSPYRIGSNGNPKESIAKAYEMMSCFEGLLEYYRATADRDALEASLKLIKLINEEEITYFGSGGGDAPFNLGPGKGEQWNRTRYEITNPGMDLAMETCVTVTYMKLMYKAFLVTGDVSFVDRIEVSLFNALLGALSDDGSYFEYFPKFNGTRGYFDNFSYKIGGMSLSCCTANGPMGLAMIPRLAVTKKNGGTCGYCINVYQPFDYVDEQAVLKVETCYPADGRVTVTVVKAPEQGINLYLKIPCFAKKYTAAVSSGSAACPDVQYFINEEPYKENGGYFDPGKALYAGGKVEIEFFYGCRVRFSLPSVNPLAKKLALYTYGPCVLAIDRSFEPSAFDNFRIPARGLTDGSSVDYDLIKPDSACCGSPFKIKIRGNVFVPYFAAGRSFNEATAFKTFFEMTQDA